MSAPEPKSEVAKGDPPMLKYAKTSVLASNMQEQMDALLESAAALKKKVLNGAAQTLTDVFTNQEKK